MIENDAYAAGTAVGKGLANLMFANGFLCVGFLLFFLLVGVTLMFYSLGELKTMVANTLHQWIDRK